MQARNYFSPAEFRGHHTGIPFHAYSTAVVLLLFAAPFVLGSDAPWPLWDNHESVADYAKRVNLPPMNTLDLGNGVKMELVLIPAGKFIMGTPAPEKPIVGQIMAGVSGGVLFVAVLLLLVRTRRKRTRLQFSMAFMLLLTFVASVGVWGGVRWHEALKHPEDYHSEHPAHQVTLTRPFYMGKFHVTQDEYQQVMGSNPSHFKGKDNPVETVSWDDAQDFLKKLPEQIKQSIRLPTEAEWEFACRAGTRTAYYSGDSESDLARVAWYGENSKRTTHPVGQKESNFFGVYDMHGNVWQWCQDRYGEDYYSHSETENPQGPPLAAHRSMRGGSWCYYSGYCRSGRRCWEPPDLRTDYIGFRVVLVSSSRTP